MTAGVYGTDLAPYGSITPSPGSLNEGYNMTVIVIPESILTQQNEMEQKIAELNTNIAALVAFREELESGLMKISHVISILNGEIPVIAPPTVSGRKPMSEEAKAKISEALKASHLRKSQLTAEVPQPASPEPAPLAEPVVAEAASKGKKKA